MLNGSASSVLELVVVPKKHARYVGMGETAVHGSEGGKGSFKIAFYWLTVDKRVLVAYWISLLILLRPLTTITAQFTREHKKTKKSCRG